LYFLSALSMFSQSLESMINMEYTPFKNFWMAKVGVFII
jgi:hypothetical protein